jgi:hypothetical protein
MSKVVVMGKLKLHGRACRTKVAVKGKGSPVVKNKPAGDVKCGGRRSHQYEAAIYKYCYRQYNLWYCQIRMKNVYLQAASLSALVDLMQQHNIPRQLRSSASDDAANGTPAAVLQLNSSPSSARVPSLPSSARPSVKAEPGVPTFSHGDSSSSSISHRVAQFAHGFTNLLGKLHCVTQATDAVVAELAALQSAVADHVDASGRLGDALPVCVPVGVTPPFICIRSTKRAPILKPLMSNYLKLFGVIRVYVEPEEVAEYTAAFGGVGSSGQVTVCCGGVGPASQVAAMLDDCLPGQMLVCLNDNIEQFFYNGSLCLPSDIRNLLNIVTVLRVGAWSVNPVPKMASDNTLGWNELQYGRVCLAGSFFGLLRPVLQSHIRELTSSLGHGCHDLELSLRYINRFGPVGRAHLFGVHCAKISANHRDHGVISRSFPNDVAFVAAKQDHLAALLSMFPQLIVVGQSSRGYEFVPSVFRDAS